MKEYTIKTPVYDELTVIDDDERGYVIDCDKKADFVLSERVFNAEIEAEYQRVLGLYQYKLNEIQQAMDAFKKREADRKAWWQQKLADYWMKVKDRARTTKTKRELAFTCGHALREKYPEPEIQRDEAQLTVWVKQHCPKFLKVSESTNWAELKKVLMIKDTVQDVDGTPIPGITLVPRDPVFEII